MDHHEGGRRAGRSEALQRQQGLGPLLEKLDKKIDDLSEKDAPTDKDKTELTQLFTKYQAIAADYLKQIVKANEKYPNAGKSWLNLHEGLKKLDFLLVDMLKQDTKVKGQWSQAYRL